MSARIVGPFRRGAAIESAVVFVAAFAWFWFWRPYGLHGGDSDLVEFNVYRGEWIRKREPLTMVLFQLSHLTLTTRFGWPVGNAISFVSCLAGAFAVVVLRHATRGLKRPYLTWALILCSGYTLTFYGAIEVYALPTAMMAFWILTISKVESGKWPNRTIPIAFVLTCLTHAFGMLLFPCLLVSAYVYRSRMTTGDIKAWLECVILVPITFLAIDLWSGQLRNTVYAVLIEALTPAPGQANFLPHWSLKHLALKAHFLWLGTGIMLPFAGWRVWSEPHDSVGIQVASMGVMTFIFFAAFHPDLGYEDWDLFLFPSLPVAFLAAPVLVESCHWWVLSTAWIAAFLSVWIPRVPVWAQLPDRGLAEVRILNPPAGVRTRLDDRYPIETNPFWVGGGMHSISFWKKGDRIRWKAFQVRPGDAIEISPPSGNVPGPFSERINRMEKETDGGQE